MIPTRFSLALPSTSNCCCERRELGLAAHRAFGANRVGERFVVAHDGPIDARLQHRVLRVRRPRRADDDGAERRGRERGERAAAARDAAHHGFFCAVVQHRLAVLIDAETLILILELAAQQAARILRDPPQPLLRGLLRRPLARRPAAPRPRLLLLLLALIVRGLLLLAVRVFLAGLLLILRALTLAVLRVVRLLVLRLIALAASDPCDGSPFACSSLPLEPFSSPCCWFCCPSPCC